MSAANAPAGIDVATLLGESLAQWGVDAQPEPAGDEVLIRCGGTQALRVAHRSGPGGGPAHWTLDDLPLASALEVLREVRSALDPDFAPRRLRISVPPSGRDSRHGPPAPAPTADAANGRLPVFVLTGFLGSGKTTVLNRLLGEQRLRDTAVIVNELGAIGIDHLLVESSEDGVVQLAGGCLCCSVRGELALTLGDLIARREAGTLPPFARILIETSGLADPTPIEALLLSDPGLAERLEIGGVTVCVDAAHGDRALERYPEAVRQVALADLVILTKTDMAPLSPALEERLWRLNPDADRVPAEFGCVHGRGGGPPTQALSPRRRRTHDDAHRNARPEPVRHADGIDTFAIVRPAPIPGAALTLFLRALVEHAGRQLLRLKGFVELAEAPRRPVTVNGTGNVFEPVEPRPGWPDGDRRSRLILIGEGISSAWCGALLDALVADVRLATERIRRPPPPRL